MHRVVGGDPLLLQRRLQVMDAYVRLQHDHPALPPSLHDFQVMSEDLVADRMASKMWQLQADITAAVVDEEERHHILSCLPTGMGKTLPMLFASQLFPLNHFLWSRTCAQHNMFFQGSIMWNTWLLVWCIDSKLCLSQSWRSSKRVASSILMENVIFIIKKINNI